jgi:hypothetical protein
MEIANSVEPVQDGRIHIERINCGATASVTLARPDGIFISSFEQGEARPFPRGLHHGTRRPGLEASRPALWGRPIEGQVKNRKHPATERVKDAFS